MNNVFISYNMIALILDKFCGMNYFYGIGGNMKNNKSTNNGSITYGHYPKFAGLLNS
jgi:hypothetical protein